MGGRRQDGSHRADTEGMDPKGRAWYISTGHLPSPRQVQAAVDGAHQMYRSEARGETSQTYPALARVPGHLFGICVAGINGSVWRAGDTGHEFAIMSVAKPFVFALVCEAVGDEQARQKLGVNATGLPFNSLASVERSADGRSNPMVNAGAIATTSLVPGDSDAAKWAFISQGLSRFAGRDLTLSEEIYLSASAANYRNRAIANLLASQGRLYCDPGEAVDLYTRQSCLLTSAEDLAVMSATLADGGISPVTGQRVITPTVCQHALAVMATAGMYETSGDWLFDVGVPGKSGIGGGIIAVSPGKGGLGTFSPLLDRAGNSIRGQLAARHLSRTLGLSLFASKAPRRRVYDLGDGAADPGAVADDEQAAPQGHHGSGKARPVGSAADISA
jgi:glutaminase